MCASTIDAESNCSGMDLGFKNRASHCVNIFPRGWLRLQSQMHLKIWGTINIFFRFVVRLHDELRTQLLWNGTVFLPRKPQCQHIPPVVGFVSHFKIMMHNQKYFSSFMRLKMMDSESICSGMDLGFRRESATLWIQLQWINLSENGGRWKIWGRFKSILKFDMRLHHWFRKQQLLNGWGFWVFF